MAEDVFAEPVFSQQAMVVLSEEEDHYWVLSSRFTS